LTVIFYILLSIILCVNLVKAEEKDYFSRIFSTEKVENNGACDDYEWVWDADCHLSNDKVFKGDYFYTAWFMRLLLAAIIIAYVWQSKILEYLVMLAIAVIIENKYGLATTTVCQGEGYFNDFGQCLLPSQPVIGWFIGILIIYFIVKKTIGKVN
jgi:hypothetical protein